MMKHLLVVLALTFVATGVIALTGGDQVSALTACPITTSGPECSGSGGSSKQTCSKTYPYNCTEKQCKSKGGQWTTDKKTGVSHCDFGGGGGTGTGGSSGGGSYDSCSTLKGTQKTACENEKKALANNDNPAANAKSCGSDPNCQEIYTYLIDTVQLLSAIVGIVVVGMIIYGGIEFSTSAGNPEKAASAKAHITNALFALLAFFFLWAFLNFLIPGGVFHG